MKKKKKIILIKNIKLKNNKKNIYGFIRWKMLRKCRKQSSKRPQTKPFIN